jgi:hypothetical protein
MAIFSINKRFEILTDLTSMVVNNITPSLIVTGEGGLGKTFTVTKAIEDMGLSNDNFVFFKGYSTARGLYNTLYDNNGKLIVFDDCDSVLEDKVAINILKSALDSYDKREISWMANMRKGDEYPQQFEFTGRIIFISNKSKDKIDGAILSRSLVVDLSMTPAEKIERMRTIVPNILPGFSDEVKEDALYFLDENKESYDINMRTLIMVSKMRYSFPETWSELATFMINS